MEKIISISEPQNIHFAGKSYFNFINSLRSEFTKKNYSSALSRFLNYYNLTTDELAAKTSKDIENLLIDYIVILKENKKSSSALNILLSSVTHFCVMNDISLMTKKIAKFKGEHETTGNNDRGYESEDIQLLVNSAPLRLKVVFLILASTGIRIGALPILRLGNLKKLKIKGSQMQLYQFTIYANSPNHSYITYCTPECAAAVDDYLAYRKRFGEKLTPDSYLIRKEFDINDLEQIRKRSEPVAYDTVKVIIRNQIIKSGIRAPHLVKADSHKRHEIPMNHGFRKFFETRLIESDVNPMAVLRLVGHKGGLDNKSYFRPKEDYILSEYEKAIDALTINEENKLRRKVRKLEMERTQFDLLASKIQALEKSVRGAKGG